MGKRKRLKPIKNNQMRNALIISLLLHLLLFVGISFSGAKGGEGSDKTGKQAGMTEDVGNILERPEDKVVEVDLVPAESVDAPAQPKPKKQVAKKECTGFGGIGVQYSSQDGTIDKVFPGYPAERAGLERGDQILSPGIREIRGAVGSQIELEVRRFNTIHKIVLVRELICTDKVLGGK